MEPHTKTDSTTQYMDDDRAGRIRAVVLDHLRRCQSDDSVTPEETIQRHADLMPGLADETYRHTWSLPALPFLPCSPGPRARAAGKGSWSGIPS